MQLVVKCTRSGKCECGWCALLSQRTTRACKYCHQRTRRIFVNVADCPKKTRRGAIRKHSNVRAAATSEQSSPTLPSSLETIANNLFEFLGWRLFVFNTKYDTIWPGKSGLVCSAVFDYRLASPLAGFQNMSGCPVRYTLRPAKPNSC